MALKDPLKNFSFLVRRANVGNGRFQCGFSNVSGLSRKVDQIKYRDGEDARYTRKFPGLVEYGDLTFEQGQFVEHSDLWKWSERVYSAKDGTSMTGTVPESQIKEDLILEQRQAGDGGVLETVKAYRLYGTWVSDYAISAFDANASDVSKTTLTVSVDYWQQVSTADFITVILA